MAIDFPNSPSVNDEFTAGGKTWVYTGASWAIVGLGPVGPAGGALAGTYPDPTLDTDALAGVTFAGTITLPSTTSIGSVSSTELGYLDGVTSAVQTQLNGKAATTASITINGATVALGGTITVEARLA